MVETAPKPRRFRPRLLPTLAVAVLLPVLLGLGRWQLARAAEKAAMAEAFAAGAATMPMPYDAGAARFGRVTAVGRWDAAHQFLLDAMVREGVAGFRVLTPLVLIDGRVLLVDRGWVAGDPARRVPPAIDIVAPAALREVVGRIDELPRAGVALAPATAADDADWPRTVLYPTHEALAAALGAPLEPRLLRLDPAAADGYARDFAPDLGMPRERHLGYAFTWFALAATLVAIWILTNLRPREPNP
jgi:surfeit locus 1 family protein